MISEDRGWYMKRLEREFKEKADKEKKQVGSAPRPRTPSKPSMSSRGRR
jgi:hypothetical protein